MNAQRNLILSIFIIAAYVLARVFIYRIVPVETDSDWLIRDTWMNVPRIAGGLLTLYFGYKVWGCKKLGFDLRGIPVAFVIGTLLLATEAFFCFTGASPFTLSSRSLVLFCLSSFLVGFFEEVLFRGALLNALSDWKGNRYALWISSFLFTVYHVQAQPLYTWPGIFIYGFIAALLRLHGVSILWLIIIHGLYDCVSGIIGRTAGISMIPWNNLALIAVVALTFVLIRKSRGSLFDK